MSGNNKNCASNWCLNEASIDAYCERCFNQKLKESERAEEAAKALLESKGYKVVKK